MLEPRQTAALFHNDDWVRFTEVFLDAERRGFSPTLTLQNTFDLPRQRVEHLIETARQLGYLRGAQNADGRLSEVLVEAAHALGVTYERLVEVIREHGNGVLRV